MKDIFHFVQKPYYLRSDSTLQRWRNCTVYLWHVFWNTSKYYLCWICRWQNSIHILFKYRKYARDLQGALENIFHWFLTNHLLANSGKCWCLASCKKPVDIHIICNIFLIPRFWMGKELSCFESILKVDLILIFTWIHFLKKLIKKYHALCKSVQIHEQKNPQRILMNAFITSQFSYCPLVWMSNSRTMNNKINKIH